MVLPNDHPHVGGHENTEHHSDADSHVVANSQTRIAGHEVFEVVLHQTGNENASDQSGNSCPTEPPQSATSHFVDSDVASLALIAKCSKGWHLNEVEVIKQTDPANAGHDVQVAEAEVSEVVASQQLHFVCPFVSFRKSEKDNT